MMRDLQEMSLTLDLDYGQLKHERKNIADTKGCLQLTDIQVVGLTFEDSKKYLLGEVVSGQETLQHKRG